MTQFTTDIMQALVKKEDISEVFRKHLETAVNTLLQTELTAFLDYEKYDLSPYSLFCKQNKKVAHRAKGYIQISMGNHNVKMIPKIRINITIIKI